MKKIRIFMFLVLSLLLVNCGKEEKKAEENTVEKTEVVATNNENKEEVINIKLSDETYKDLEIFVKNKEEVIKKLKGLSKEEADKLLDKYMKENQELTSKIDENENYFMEENGAYYPEEKMEKIEKFFNKYGFKIEGTAGGPALNVPSSFYYSIFKDYVSDEYRDYLELTSKYNDVDVALTPGGLSIQETGERNAAFQDFLDKYPDSKFNVLNEDGEGGEVASVYVYYIDEYMRYSLPYKDGSPEDYYKISEENMKEYKQFIEKYPDSITTKCLKYFLKNYENQDHISISEGITEIIKKEMKERYNITELFGL